MGVAEYLETIEHPKDKAHKKRCKQCIYRYRGTGGAGCYCQYILVTGHRRPCPAEDCKVYEKGKPKQTIACEMFSHNLG